MNSYSVRSKILLLAAGTLLGFLLSMALARTPESNSYSLNQSSLPATPVFRFPVVPNTEVSGYFDHRGTWPDASNGFVTFYNGRQNTGSAYANGFWFTCPGVGNGWVGCEVVASNEATCPDNKELWYDAHHGVDFEYAVNWRTGSSCNRGQFSGVARPVYAPAAGEVYDKGFNSANGNFFRIKHDLNNNGNYDDDNFRSVYLHFASGGIAVNNGDRVSEGQYLGLGGMTGLAWTPHLHFEVQRFIGGQWVPVDPYGWNGSLSSDPWPYRDYNYPLWRHLIYLPLVTKQPTDTYEPNNSFSTAYSIALSSWYELYIWTTSDQDWYQFSVSVPPNQARYIRALLQSIPPGTDYDIEIYSPSNALLGRANRIWQPGRVASGLCHAERFISSEGLLV